MEGYLPITVDLAGVFPSVTLEIDVSVDRVLSLGRASSGSTRAGAVSESIDFNSC